MKSFAQNGEDLILAGYFEKKGVNQGTFLDVGANDGITLSNTWLFAFEMGWAGIWVEPGLKAYKKLLENTLFVSGVQINVAISDSVGYETLHSSGEHLGKGDTGLLSTLIPSEMARWKGTETFTEEVVRTCKIEDLEIEGPVDLVSIDCEGMDFEVLKQCPLQEWETLAICIEYNANEKLKTQICAYVKPFGFRLLESNYENLILVK